MIDHELRIKELERELEKKEKEVDSLKIQNVSLKNYSSKLESEIQQFQDLFYSSTSLLAIFKGPDHIIEIANDALIEGLGKGKELIFSCLIVLLDGTNVI